MLAIGSTALNGLTGVLWPNAGAVAQRAATKCMAIDGIVAQGGLAVPADVVEPEVVAIRYTEGAHPAATGAVEVDTPGCSQPGRRERVAADCATGLSTLSCKLTSAETAVPSPSRGSGRGPSMEGRPTAKRGRHARASGGRHTQCFKEPPTGTKRHDDNHTQAITNQSLTNRTRDTIST